VIKEVGNCRIGTAMGRYYSMDRSRNWDLTDIAYHCIVCGEGRKTDAIETAVKESYENDKTPDGAEMADEYIPPYVIGDYDGVKDGDSILHTNYRQDRAIQLTMAFTEDSYEGKLKAKPKVFYLGLTRYWDEFTLYMLGAMGGGGAMDNLLGESISKAGIKQLRIAETQKFRHVTSFFNGKSTTPCGGEDQVDVPSRFDPATFGSHPEMEAYNVTDELMKVLNESPEKYGFIAVNYANCDMVGHTGDMAAATKAVEVVDECVGKLVDKCLELDAHILITADHGNAEQMVDYETGMTKTSHTLNPVELIYVAKDAEGRKLIARGKLSDIAPTVLYLLGLEIPKEMTANNIICDEKTCCGGSCGCK
ncbi:MAG: alkaline phosphatase family protein, partial [Planctomycetes bacterium]|nr:alkaline phosphatase family protein [Planctomycetota bacterium]